MFIDYFQYFPHQLHYVPANLAFFTQNKETIYQIFALTKWNFILSFKKEALCPTPYTIQQLHLH